MTGDWELGLEQDADLVTVHGSAATVADAVRRGADLRLYMTTETYEETLYFQQTYAGPGEAFAGLMSHHHSYVHHGQPIEEPYVSLFKYDASGFYAHLKWMLGDRVLDESGSYGYGVYRWFVCDRWRVVYEHDADGNTVAGDLAELIDCVRDGRSLRVGVRQLFGLSEDDPSGPQHVGFLTTMQPVVRDGHVQSNCDFVLVGAPQWPFAWSDGLHLAVMQPSTAGDILSFTAQPGKLPFVRQQRNRAMQWLVADVA